MPRRILTCAAALLMSLPACGQASRHFTFHYAFTVKNLPPHGNVKIWFPAATSDNFQEVKVISAKGDLPLKKTRDSKFGDEMYFAETSKAKTPDLHFEVIYDVVRHERLVVGRQIPRLAQASLDEKERKEFLGADKLVPVSGLPAELAVKTVEGKSGTLDKARAIYDYVFANMRYDKSGTGWGHGDVLYACNAKHGNCTDFHSLFIAMARSQEIPARFEIGFAIPIGKAAGDIAGYHCWADFFDPERGWVPVDISEAWLDPVKKNYFFGALDENRVQFSMGRDLTLNPRQKGEPVNYFVYPYVEVAGQPYPNVSQAFSFADEGTATAKR